MARKTRVDYPGAWHHVMHRGARREAIFKDDAQVLLFLDLLDKVVGEKTETGGQPPPLEM